MAERERYIDFATHPERYKHWKLQPKGGSPRWLWTSRKMRRWCRAMS